MWIIVLKPLFNLFFEIVFVLSMLVFHFSEPLRVSLNLACILVKSPICSPLSLLYKECQGRLRSQHRVKSSGHLWHFWCNVGVCDFFSQKKLKPPVLHSGGVAALAISPSGLFCLFFCHL